MNEYQIGKQQRKLAGIFLFASFLFSYLSWLFMNLALNMLDEGYYQLELFGRPVSSELVVGDIAKAGVWPLIVSALFMGLPILGLCFKYKGRGFRWRYWVLLFLACWWASNFGSVVVIVPYLSKYKILPALQ